MHIISIFHGELRKPIGYAASKPLKYRVPAVVPTGSSSSWKHWDTGSIPHPTQWVKDPALLQLQLRSQVGLRCDPWPRNSICRGAAKKKGKKKRNPSRSSLAVQQVKDLVSLLQWLGLLLWLAFSTWPRNFYMLQARPENKQTKKLL